MNLKCPVSGSACDENTTKCEICGFEDALGIARIIASREEAEYRLERVIKPLRMEWELKQRKADNKRQTERLHFRVGQVEKACDVDNISSNNSNNEQTILDLDMKRIQAAILLSMVEAKQPQEIFDHTGNGLLTTSEPPCETRKKSYLEIPRSKPTSKDIYIIMMPVLFITTVAVFTFHINGIIGLIGSSAILLVLNFIAGITFCEEDIVNYGSFTMREILPMLIGSCFYGFALFLHLISEIDFWMVFIVFFALLSFIAALILQYLAYKSGGKLRLRLKILTSKAKESTKIT